MNQKAKEKHLTVDIMSALKVLCEAFEKINDNDWKKEKIHEVIVATAERLGLKMGKIAQPLRVAVTGNITSPSIDITCELIEKQRVLHRINLITDFFKGFTSFIHNV